MDTSSGVITYGAQFTLPFQFNYYETSQYVINGISASIINTQSVLSYPTVVFETIDANTFRLNIQNWMVDQTTGQTVLAYLQLVALRSTFNSATLGYAALITIPSAFPPVSAPLIYTTINNIITYRQFIWNIQSLQYATYTRDLTTNIYSFQEWTTVQLPTGWGFPTWVTRHYILSSTSTGYILLSYYTPFTAIGGYNPPSAGNETETSGSFPVSTTFVFDIIVPWLIIFVPPAILGIYVGKIGFFVGLVLTLSVGTYVGIVPIWVIFLVGLGLILLLYSRFGRRDNNVGEED
jgi:hypothetical protein